MNKLGKFLVLVIVVSVIISCYNDVMNEDGIVQQATMFQKGKPTALTVEDVQLMIDESLKTVYGQANSELINLYYSRRETVKNEWNISMLEEINSEDYKVQVARSGKGSFFWMDDNPSNANMIFDVNEDGGFSKIHINNNFLLFTQDKGIYSYTNLKTFNTNEEARAYFESVNWRKLNTLYKTSDGTVKATY